MKFNDPVSSVLARKGMTVLAIPQSATVYEALTVMADHDIGALLVTDNSRPVGMFSERDYARKLILLGRSSAETAVWEAMSAPVYSLPGDSVDSCLRVMTTMRLRHLVVMDGSNIAGIVSIGDLVNWMISVQAETIDHLSRYVSGAYPG